MLIVPRGTFLEVFIFCFFHWIDFRLYSFFLIGWEKFVKYYFFVFIR